MKHAISTSILIILGGSAVLGASLPPVETDELVPSFGPEQPQTYTPFHLLQDGLFISNVNADPEQTAITFAKDHLGHADFTVKSVYKSDLSGVTHVYLRQTVNGLPVMNSNMNINVKDGVVLSFGESFARRSSPSVRIQHESRPLFESMIYRGLDMLSNTFSQTVFGAKKPSHKQDGNYVFVNNDREFSVSPADALMSLMAYIKPSLPDPSIVQNMTPDMFTAIKSLHGDSQSVQFENVPFVLSPVQVNPAYITLDNGDLEMVWDVEMELQDNWYSGRISAHDGRVVSLNDWVSQSAYYNVIPFGANDPSDSSQVLVKDPNDGWASPEGWHSQGTLVSGRDLTFNVTIGNNVYAHTNPDGGYNWLNNYRPSGRQVEGKGDIIFDFKANFDRQEPDQYEDAAVTNLFYWCNMAHDLYYRYGFDEKAGNFQQDNLGRGRSKDDDGSGDAVVANAQDGSGRNNANFATPPDGRHGKMRMYVWDQTEPMRDGDFESGIVMHEYTHGVSNRLTGGPHDSNCLGWGEAGGMGEGWGDFVSTIIRMKPEYTRRVEFDMGSWSNGGEGIRKYRYSTNNATNPSTYKIMDRFDYWGVHAKGEVWAEMLYEVYWNLVDRHGFTPDWFPPVPAQVDDRGLPVMTEEDQAAIRNHIVSHGNTLALQLVLDGMKLQKCSPSFIDARDAILDADKVLTGGDNFCTIYEAFAKRGLGYGAKLTKEGWVEKRIESYVPPRQCTS